MVSLYLNDFAMDVISYLSKLLANFVYLQYKFHSMHTDMPACPVRQRNHEFMNDVYTFFGDEHIDRIKERARILGGNTPCSIFELSQLTDVKELQTVPPMMEMLQIVIGDLQMMEELLNVGMELTQSDLVTQGKLINFNDTVGTMRWKLQMMLPNEPLHSKMKK